MRVKLISKEGREDYDKDIWRSGGSASKEQIKTKWSAFNQLLIGYFNKNSFMES